MVDTTHRYNSLSLTVSEILNALVKEQTRECRIVGDKLFTSFVISLEPSTRRLGYKRNCYVVLCVTLCDKHETSVKWPQCQDGNLLLI